MRFLFISLAFFCFAFNAEAKELFVDAARGNDAVSYADNNRDNPWASIGRAVWGSTSRTNPIPGEAASAGDVVTVAAGVYTATQGTGERYIPIWNPVNSGSPGSDIVIRADGDVVLRSQTNTAGEPIIGTVDRAYIVWDGFIVDEPNINTKADTGPVVVWGSSHVTIQGLTIIGKRVAWVDNHNSIRLEGSQNVLISNNVMWGNRGGDNSRNGSAIMLYRCSNITIANNEISDSSGGIFVKGDNEGPITIHHNLLFDLSSEGITFGIIGTPSAQNGAVAYQNIIRDSMAGISFIGYNAYSPANVTIRNNTLHNLSNGGIFLKPGTGGYRNLVFRDNLITGSARAIQGEDISDLSQTTFEHNFYFNNPVHARTEYRNHSFEYWTGTMGKDANSTNAVNPQYANPAANIFTLSQGSPALSAGSGGGAVGAHITGDEIIGAVDRLNRPNPPANVSVD